MPQSAATQPAAAPESVHVGWWAAMTLAAVKLAHKAIDLWRFRASVEARLFRRLEESLQGRIADLEQRIQTLEAEKNALQQQNQGQGERIAALEKELAADKALRHQLRDELQAVTAERDAARAELARRDGK